MNLEKLNKLCFTTCIVCIIVGVVLTLGIIWGPVQGGEFIWKSWLTIAVFFGASAMTLLVTSMVKRNKGG